jgi:predicted ATPase
VINAVSVHNFKCLRDIRVNLERFTVFVGPNASGKSSILKAMDLLCGAFKPDNNPYQPNGAILASQSRGATKFIEFVAEARPHAFRNRIDLENGGMPRFHNHPQWDGYGLAVAASMDEGDWKPWANQSLSLPASVMLALETSKLVDTNFPTEDPTAIGPSGFGLHSATANMALNDPDSWQALQANLRRVVPTIRRLRHTKATMHQPTRALLFDTVGADSVPADQMSEGTLLVLGLLTAFHAPSRPNLVLLDDLDRGLHPRAQKELITLLRGLLDTNPDLQIVANTHSPYMLDCMAVGEIRMTILNDDGATVCAPLTSHPKYPKWKDEMAPGEMWSLFGEKWLIDQEVTA